MAIFFDQVTAAIINRRYRITYRDMKNGLLAGGAWRDMTTPELVAKAHELTVASLQQYKAAEV